VHKNTASRRISRLTARVKSLASWSQLIKWTTIRPEALLQAFFIWQISVGQTQRTPDRPAPEIMKAVHGRSTNMDWFQELAPQGAVQVAYTPWTAAPAASPTSCQRGVRRGDGLGDNASHAGRNQLVTIVNAEVGDRAKPRGWKKSLETLRVYEPYAMFCVQTAWRKAFGLEAQQRHLWTLV
jgi:hypothetical protein